jgi:formylglycine-generating enzyme required for sulfatase activity
MGSTDAQIEAVFEMCEALRGEGECYHPLYERESPQHKICFDEPFWIDRTEVTNGQFATFGGVAELESDFPGDDLPREMVSWFEGRDYCDQRGARLPTEAEWEYAARGPDSLVYPWGNQFDGTRLNYCDQNCTFDWADQAYDDGYEKVAPVGSYEGGFSWVGAYDMSGNVWEWTSTIFGYREEDQWQEIFPFPYDPSDGRETISDENTAWRVLRGGSWRYDNNIAHSASRHGNYPDLRGDNTGFRCVRSYNNGD